MSGKPSKKEYKKQLRKLQIELVKLQRNIIEKQKKVFIILEGRDAAGKDGTIKRITEHMSPRETRVVALGKPSDKETLSWYFQRYVPHLPSGGELVLFNRSWYNRAGVERVMDFCSDDEFETFISEVVSFEGLLHKSNLQFFKYYLDIDKDEQKERLEDRKEDPLKQWKVSPIDEKALGYFDDYSKARDEMFARTHTAVAPWIIVRANHKKTARLNIIRDFLTRMDYPDKDHELVLPDPDVVFTYERESWEKIKSDKKTIKK